MLLHRLAAVESMLPLSQRPPPSSMQPPPNSQLCGGMAFSMSLFFPGRAIDPALLEPALRGVLSELPHLAGRGATLGSGSRLADTVLRCSNAGVELATAAAPAVRLQDVGPHTWSSYNADRPPGALPLPFYAQPLNAAASMAGRAPPVGLRCAESCRGQWLAGRRNRRLFSLPCARMHLTPAPSPSSPLWGCSLTDLADGQVLNLGFWHVVADAGRGLSLAGRLADHYR